MRSDVVRVYKTVHTWTGILCGMALFIAFYAGALTLFKERLVAWATPPAVVSAVPLSEAGALIARTLASQPEVAKGFEIHVQHGRPDRMTWDKHEGDDEHDALSVRHFAARLADDGALRSEEVKRTHLGELLDVLHRVVGLPVDNDVTRLFMGVIATLYFLALFSGLVTLLPSLVKDLFAFRVGPNLKRMWLDAHNIVGLGSFPFHVVMALTAAVFAFHDGIYLVQNSLLHEGKLGGMFGARGAPDDAPRDPATMVPPEEILKRVAAVAPTFEPTLLRYMRVDTPKANVFVFGHDARSLEQRALGGLAIVEPYSGRVMGTSFLPGHQTGPETLLSAVFALHFGSYGGTPVKLIYFVLAMMGAWLVYSGNLLWIETRRKRDRNNGVMPVQRRDTRWMASATVGVCLGALCGISLTVVCAKWLHGVEDLNAWHRRIYYAAFLGSIAWSFWRGPRAGVDLLRAASALTFAIPLTSLLALVPGLGLWTHMDTLAVDGMALVLGLSFTWLARAAARRVYAGSADSVWYAGTPVAAE